MLQIPIAPNLLLELLHRHGLQSLPAIDLGSVKLAGQQQRPL